MSTLQILDLDRSPELDVDFMSVVRGGFGVVTVNVPINVTQTINQTQTTSVLNDSTVGATFGGLNVPVNPVQLARNDATFPALPN